METELSKEEFSEFGIYSVEKTMELTLPSSEIKITKRGEKKYSYRRKDSENNVETKLITTQSEPLKIHLAPIGALHKPSSETKFMFLRFDHKVLIDKGSSVELTVPCPIEMGVFRITNEGEMLLDSFPCEPLHSRFAIYGPADTGLLCKYAKVLPDVSHSEPYVYGTIQATIKNEKERDVSLGRLVFPLSNLDAYYNGTKVVFDGLTVTLKDTVGGLPPAAEISPVDNTDKSDWTKSPNAFTKDTSVFVMEHGFS